MANEAPKWLNEEFILRSLQGKDKSREKIEIIKFTCGPAVPEGTNYGSCIFQVNIDYIEGNENETQSLSLIVKSPLQNATLYEMFNPAKDVESRFYNQYLPIARKLNNDSFAPKCYFSPDPSVIIMENLKKEGFIMKDRCLQLDFDHCQLYTIISATFHAVSIAVHKTNAEILESIGEEKLFSDGLKSTECYITMMNQGLECTSDFMEKNDFKKYAKLVQHAKSYLSKEVINAFKPSKGLNALNQGDPWTTNMMFKYNDSGEVSEIRLLDFQALRYGSPINDLVFFLWSSANHDVRENRMNDIFQLYCKTLNDKLKELNCTETLTYNDLMKAVKALNPFVLFMVVTFVPVLVNPGSLDISDFVSVETDVNGQPINKLKKFYTEYFCEEFLLKYLKQMEHIGVSEYLERHA